MLQQLYPGNATKQPLKRTYLNLNLHQEAKPNDIFIYANYISSLDGRISLFDHAINDFAVPKSIANKRDWQLYQELAGQSDVMITSARYFRQLAVGKAQDLLPVGIGDDYVYIRDWRQAQGLNLQPDVVVLSNSLDIPKAALAQIKDRKVIVLTGNAADPTRVTVLEKQGVVVIQSKQHVDGVFIRARLINLGYKSAYMIAGPKVHQTLIKSDCLDALFLTTHLSLVGGKDFHGLIDEDLPKAAKMKLEALYLDKEMPQMFGRYSYVDGAQQ